MILIYIAIPVALVIAAAAVLAFIWAARNDQYEDLHTPAIRMLLDDAPVINTNSDAAKRE
jgi:cbb3-type cytochrome oxidase maturation protein